MLGFGRKSVYHSSSRGGGSFGSHRLAVAQDCRSRRGGAHGLCPGCLSEGGSPIYVATPASGWDGVYDLTLPERRRDLVLAGNGLLPEQFRDCTVVVPHYGVLEIGEKPVTSPSSPPTYIYGRHSDKVLGALKSDGVVRTAKLSSWRDIQLAAARKLLWASCLWLLCHDETPALTASQVHQRRPEKLGKLVRELYPAFLKRIGKTATEDNDDTLGSSLEELLEYMGAYSNSMPEAIPSLELAVSEVCERNGVFLTKSEQPFHRELLERVGGPEASKILDRDQPTQRNKPRVTPLADLDLRVYGTKATARPCRSAIVVGAGVIGSCLAMNLARRGIQVTVLERGSSKETGVTTPASWAWLNANQKDPPHYRWLNQLGMLSWRRDKALRKYPVWSGSLVQYKEQPKASRLAGYEHEGPLDSERLLELEPHATFSDGPVYYFPGEGYVDPAEAVTAMRQIASDKGATFLFEHNATKLLYNDKDSTKQRVCGVVCTSMNSGGNEAASSRIMADVVVITCGAGDSSTDLGGVPLADRPGCLAFAKPRSADASPRLSRLLIDTVNAAHVQQRQDGTIAMGGGTLELGGSSLAPRTTCSAATTVSHHYGQDDQNPLLAGAHRIAPSVVKHTAYSHSASAVRPFPKDGLPVTGYSKPGLYSIVTHSGVTLAPILGALAAAEIVDGTDLDILRPYRRTRFAFS